MLLASLRSLFGHKVRLVLSTLAITLAVGFVSGSFVFTNLLDSAVTNIIKGTLADVNVAVAGTYAQEPSGGTPPAEEQTLEPINLTAITGIGGVEEVIGGLTVTDIYPLDAQGRTIGTPGAPSVTSNWFTAPAADGGRGIVLRSGNPPEAADEVVVDPDTLEAADLELGETITLRTPTGEIAKTVVGTADWGDSGGTAGGTYQFLSTPEMQNLATDGRDVYFFGWVVAEPGVDPVDLATRIERVLPEGFEAISGQEAADLQADSVAESLGFLTTFLLVFAGIAVLVASFLIVNTFNILVTQRSRELALLRAVGAKRGQVRRSVLLEALVIGVVAATLGLVLGLGLAWGIKGVFGAIGVDLGTIAPTLTWDAVLASYGVGVVVTVVAALVPAVRAARVPPVVAMSGDNVVVERGFDPVGWIGFGLLVIGLVLLGLGGWGSFSVGWWLIGAGAVLALVGSAIGTPVIARPVVLLLGRLFQKAVGEIGLLAQRNALRTPRRLAATASALMIGLTLVTTVSILGASANATIRQTVTDGLRGDLQVSSLFLTPFEAQVITDAEAVEGVDRVYAIWQGSPVSIDGAEVTLTSYPEDTFNQVVAQEMAEGRFPAATGEVMISSYRAERTGWQLGDVLAVAGTAAEPTELTIVGVYDNPDGAPIGSFVVNPEQLDLLSPQRMVVMASVYLADGADPDSVRSALQEIIAEAPDLRVTDTTQWADLQIEQVSSLLNLLYGLLGLALVIAILGIVNTLGLAIIERTREIGLMRAIGLTRKQLRMMITLEAVTIAIVGSLMGTMLGLVCGVTIRQAAAGDGLSQLAVPWGQLGFFVLLAALVGIIAAVWPARRAAKLDVLAAIATD